MQSNIPLPARIALPPSEQQQLLAVFTPERPGSSFHYKYRFDLGIYTGHAPDSTIAYSLPFQAASDTIKIRQKLKHRYTFYLPVGTPVVAARDGIVAYIRDGRASAWSSKKANLIFVNHSDGTFGSYENITQNSAAVKVGQQVKQGDMLGDFGGNKHSPVLWFKVFYPTLTGLEVAPVTFQEGKGQAVSP